MKRKLEQTVDSAGPGPVGLVTLTSLDAHHAQGHAHHVHHHAHHHDLAARLQAAVLEYSLLMVSLSLYTVQQLPVRFLLLTGLHHQQNLEQNLKQNQILHQNPQNQNLQQNLGHLKDQNQLPLPEHSQLCLTGSRKPEAEVFEKAGRKLAEPVRIVFERFLLFIVHIAKQLAMDTTLVCGPFTRKLFDACWVKLAATHRQFNASMLNPTESAATGLQPRPSVTGQQQQQQQQHHHSHHSTKQRQQQPAKDDCSGTVCGRPSPRTEELRSLQSIFHSIDIYPTEAQVYEMIQFARRCSHSSTAALHPEQINHHTLTFGEFCSVVNEFIANSNVPKPVPKWLNQTFLCKIDQAERDAFMNPRSSATNLDIFLGGSCNPTTWRKDIVIPELKRLGITYYNPQVEHWAPELIELENQAKQNCEILFFVVDNQTRAIASMIEIACIVATKRKLILVISDFTRDNCKNGISDEEFEMLLRGREYLRDVVERQGIPVFTEILPAINCAARVLRENIAPQDLDRCGDELIPVRQGHISVGDRIYKMFDTFELLKCFARDYLAKQNSAISLSRSSSSESPDDEDAHLPRKQFKKRNSKVVKIDKLTKSTISKLEKIELNLEQFYCVMTELYRMLESQEDSQNIESAKTISNLLAAKLNRVLRSVKTVSSQVKAVFATSGNGHPQVVGKMTAKQVARSRIAHSYSTRGPASASLNSSRTSLFDIHELSRTSHRHSLVSGLPAAGCTSAASAQSAGGVMHKHGIHHAKHLPHSPKSAAFPAKQFSKSNISVSTSSLASSVLYNTDKSLYIAGIADEAYIDQVPLLKKFAVTYATHKRNSWTSARMVPVEAANFDRSKVILFVIQDDSVDISLMVTAAYYIGLQYNVVMCIQNIDNDKTQPKMRLSENAIKDYNRGRSYLSDFATKVGVPVFSDLKEAFHCCVEKVHEQ